MDTAFGFLIGSVVLIGWILSLGYAFRNRIRLMSWLNAADATDTKIPDRKTVLERRIITSGWKLDDAKEELEQIVKKEKPI